MLLHFAEKKKKGTEYCWFTLLVSTKLPVQVFFWRNRHSRTFEGYRVSGNVFVIATKPHERIHLEVNFKDNFNDTL